MSDTPLTDKRCEESQKLLKMATRFAWMCDHARRLERENAALRAAPKATESSLANLRSVKAEMSQEIKRLENLQ